MKTYEVVWNIDIQAESPEEAASEALKIQRDVESIATIFTVNDETGSTKVSYEIEISHGKNK